MARVKNAEAADFPSVLEEWHTLFDEAPNGWEGRPKNTLRWMLGVWLLKDREGFVMTVTGPDFDESHLAAEVLVRMMPEVAAELVFSPAHGELDMSFASSAAEELAANHPAIYLRMDPDGTFDVTPGVSFGEDDWVIAIASLAKTDPEAAANACLGWNRENADRTVSRALVAAITAWDGGNAVIAEWVSRIENPQFRLMATHARLRRLAADDPRAALSELFTVDLGDGCEGDARLEIVSQLARADLIEALELVRKVEAGFARSSHGHRADPFDDSPFEEEGDPFRYYNPKAGYWAASGENTVEDNQLRTRALEVAGERLPDDPIQLFGKLHNLSRALSGSDSPWMLGIEAALIRQKSGQWSGADCLTAASLWVERSNRAEGDATLRQLLTRAAHDNPEEAMAALDQVPELARPILVREIIKHLPLSEPDQRIALLSHLSAPHWDAELGRLLGKNAEDYAHLMASLPAETRAEARQSFSGTWGMQDPEAAARWLTSLPDDAASAPFAAGIASAWVSYDEYSSTEWAAAMPAGPARDGAASSLAKAFAEYHPHEAWQWASFVSDPGARAEALSEVGAEWGRDAPDEFRAALAEARHAAGLPGQN